MLRRILNFAGGQGYEKGSPCSGERHHPSRDGTITGGAFCRALQSGFGTTREIPSHSWYKMSGLEWMNEAFSTLQGGPAKPVPVP